MTELDYDGVWRKMTGLGGRRKKMTGGVEDIRVGDVEWVEDMGVGDDGWGGRYWSGR